MAEMQEDKRLDMLRLAAENKEHRVTTVQIDGVSIAVYHTVSALKKLDYVNFVIESGKLNGKIDSALLHIAAEVAAIIYFTDLGVPKDTPLCDFHDMVTDCGLLEKVKEVAGAELALLNQWVWEAYEASLSAAALFGNMETSEELISKMKAAYDSFDPEKLQEIGKSFRYARGDFEPENAEDLLRVIQEQTTLDREGAKELLHVMAMTAAGGQYGKDLS